MLGTILNYVTDEYATFDVYVRHFNSVEILFFPSGVSLQSTLPTLALISSIYVLS
jgi:hypothetical protein